MMSRTKKSSGLHKHHGNACTIWKRCVASIMDISLPLDFKEFLKLLNDKGVEYLLIGGYAVAYYGYPRATNDIDIWIAVNPQNAERVVSALREFGFDMPDLSTALFLETNRIVRMGRPPMRIEIATSISGVEFGDCYGERLIEIIDGVEVPLISLHHLKANKRASGRYKDLNDLEYLP